MNTHYSKMHIYSFEHWDIFDGIYFEAVTEPLERLLFSRLISDAGWDGTGTIAKFYIAPFFLNPDNNSSSVVYHLKMDTNGTSFFGLNSPLPFEHYKITYHGEKEFGIKEEVTYVPGSQNFDEPED